MLIGELVTKTGFSRDTIRYYETRGLLEAPLRRDNKYKDYPESVIIRLLFIKDMQGLGFTLREIGEFIELFDAGEATCENTGPRIRAHMDTIDEKIARLQTMRSRMAESFSACKGNGPQSPCTPIVESLTKTS